MPIVTIQITREGTTPEQKAALIKGATDLLVNVLNKPPGLTFVLIQEVEMEDWGVGGHRRNGGRVGCAVYKQRSHRWGDVHGRPHGRVPSAPHSGVGAKNDRPAWRP